MVQAGTAGAVVAALAATNGQPGAGTAATLFVVLLVAVGCFRPVRDLNKAWHAGYLGLTAVDGIDDILSARPPVTDAGTATSPLRTGHPPDLVVMSRDVVAYTPRRLTKAKASRCGVELSSSPLHDQEAFVSPR